MGPLQLEGLCFSLIQALQRQGLVKEQGRVLGPLYESFVLRECCADCFADCSTKDRFIEQGRGGEDFLDYLIKIDSEEIWEQVRVVAPEIYEIAQKRMVATASQVF